MEYGSRSERCLFSAGLGAANELLTPWPSTATLMTAVRANEAVWPADVGEIFVAGFVSGESIVELDLSLWKALCNHREL